MTADGKQGTRHVDPVRWRDDETASPAARLLVEAIRRPQSARPTDLARLEAAVRHTTTASARSAWGASRLIPAAAAVLVIFGALGAAYAVWRTRQLESPSVPLGRTTAARIARPAPAIVPLGDSDTPELPDSSSAAAPRARVRRRPVAHSPAEPTVDSLDQETSLISQARALVASEPEEALALLGRHRRTFPTGQLGAEREFLTVEALVRLRRLSEARARAAALSARYPTSSYSARATRLLREARKLPGSPTFHQTSADGVPAGAP